jgi:hypothetical protein
MPTATETKLVPHGTVQKSATHLMPGPEWASFEQFRTRGSSALDPVGGGRVGTLRTKADVFRVLSDEDFQSLVGLASEVERLKSGLTTIVHAIKVVRENPASLSAVELLLHVATQYAGTPELPGRRRHEPAIPEAGPVPEDDEVIVDPAEVRKRAGRR